MFLCVCACLGARGLQDILLLASARAVVEEALRDEGGDVLAAVARWICCFHQSRVAFLFVWFKPSLNCRVSVG